MFTPINHKDLSVYICTGLLSTKVCCAPSTSTWNQLNFSVQRMLLIKAQRLDTEQESLSMETAGVPGISEKIRKTNITLMTLKTTVFKKDRQYIL